MWTESEAAATRGQVRARGTRDPVIDLSDKEGLQTKGHHVWRRPVEERAGYLMGEPGNRSQLCWRRHVGILPQYRTSGFVQYHRIPKHYAPPTMVLKIPKLLQDGYHFVKSHDVKAR